MKKKTVAASVVGAAVVAAVVITGTKPKDISHPKAGYQVERQENGKYSLFKDNNGEKKIMGKDLSAKQVDYFLEKK